MTGLDAAVTDGGVERQRHGSGRGVALGLQRRDDLVRGQAELVRSCLDDADIRLMWHQPVEVGANQSIGGQCFVADIFQGPHRELEHRLSVHVQEGMVMEDTVLHVAGSLEDMALPPSACR